MTDSLLDIVERLRAWPVAHDPGDDPHRLTDGDARLYLEAADEIERLLKLIDTLDREKTSEREMYTNAIDRYCAEIDQLRAQVRRLQQQIDQGGDDL